MARAPKKADSISMSLCEDCGGIRVTMLDDREREVARGCVSPDSFERMRRYVMGQMLDALPSESAKVN